MKNYVLYHSNCPDGAGAALAAYLKLGENAEYIPVNYGKGPPEIEPNSNVYIVDFSYPRAQLEEIAAKAHLIVLDHHLTAEKELAGLPFCVFDMNKSGAVMAWEYFHPATEVPRFIRYLEDRDLWRFKLPLSREFSAAVGSYPLDFRLWAANKWAENPSAVNVLACEGIICLRLKNQQVEIMAKNSRWVYFDTTVKDGCVFFDPVSSPLEPLRDGVFVAPVANATVFFSEVGEKLLELNPDAQFSAYYFDRASDEKRQWGLRSRPDFDCSVIAKAFGGGGHKNAAGFTEDL